MTKLSKPTGMHYAMAERIPLLQLLTEGLWMFYHLSTGVTTQLQKSLQRSGKR